MVTKAEFLFMIQLEYIPSHTVHTAAHCNSLQPAANDPVHIPSHLVHTLQQIISAHTLQQIFSAHTVHYLVPVLYNTFSDTFEHPQGKSIPLLDYLQNSQQTLMVDCSSPYDEEDWLIVAVH